MDIDLYEYICMNIRKRGHLERQPPPSESDRQWYVLLSREERACPKEKLFVTGRLSFYDDD